MSQTPYSVKDVRPVPIGDARAADALTAPSAVVPPPPESLPPLAPAVRDWFRPAEPPEVPPADSLCLAGYRLLREVGRGGMGVVYEAEQLDLKRVVAVKLLHPVAPLRPDHLARFRGE